MSQQHVIVKEFISNAVYRMDECSRMIEIAFEHLSEDDLWKRPNEKSNSIGNLILHLCGNITQYAIASLGETKDERQRDIEFSSTSGYTKKDLIRKLMDTVSVAKDVISNATEEQLLKKREVQGFYFSGLGNVLHVVEHYSYHTGQIAFYTKILKKSSLGFYDGINLNTKNKE